MNRVLQEGPYGQNYGVSIQTVIVYVLTEFVLWNRLTSENPFLRTPTRTCLVIEADVRIRYGYLSDTTEKMGSACLKPLI